MIQLTELRSWPVSGISNSAAKSFSRMSAVNRRKIMGICQRNIADHERELISRCKKYRLFELRVNSTDCGVRLALIMRQGGYWIVHVGSHDKFETFVNQFDGVIPPFLPLEEIFMTGEKSALTKPIANSKQTETANDHAAHRFGTLTELFQKVTNELGMVDLELTDESTQQKQIEVQRQGEVEQLAANLRSMETRLTEYTSKAREMQAELGRLTPVLTKMDVLGLQTANRAAHLERSINDRFAKAEREWHRLTAVDQEQQLQLTECKQLRDDVTVLLEDISRRNQQFDKSCEENSNTKNELANVTLAVECLKKGVDTRTSALAAVNDQLAERLEGLTSEVARKNSETLSQLRKNTEGAVVFSDELGRLARLSESNATAIDESREIAGELAGKVACCETQLDQMTQMAAQIAQLRLEIVRLQQPRKSWFFRMTIAVYDWMRLPAGTRASQCE